MISTLRMVLPIGVQGKPFVVRYFLRALVRVMQEENLKQNQNQNQDQDQNQSQNQIMKSLPREEQPYEKCYAYGPEVLTDKELLSVILRTGKAGMNSLALAGQVLKATQDTAYPGLQGLMHLSVSDLCTIPGIGKVKAMQLRCVGELSKRIASSRARGSLCFTNPETIADYYMERLRHQEQEVMMGMMLDTKGHLLKETEISKGTVNASAVSPREIFVEALRLHAVSIILVHNHPSGDPTPSQSDIDLTQRVKEVGELVGIHLVDHVVIGDMRHFSFRGEGLI